MKSVQSSQGFLMLLLLMLPIIVMTAPVAELEERQEERHFGFQTDNGQQRSEDITYKIIVNTDTAGRANEEPDGVQTPKPVEYRGGYSFISADGYEYQVRYKANQNGFQPYVTAHKVQSAETKNKV